MKRTLKTWMAALICTIALGFNATTAQADNERPIEISQLPAAARTVVQRNFASHKVALAKVESGLIEKSYDVIFTNGDKIEFDRRGNWSEISCKNSGVPAALVPVRIASYVKSNYADARITKIERGNKGYEIELSNGFEITFDTKFRVTDIDR